MLENLCVCNSEIQGGLHQEWNINQKYYTSYDEMYNTIIIELKLFKISLILLVIN